MYAAAQIKRIPLAITAPSVKFSGGNIAGCETQYGDEHVPYGRLVLAAGAIFALSHTMNIGSNIETSAYVTTRNEKQNERDDG
jgi:hypothetical protein